MKRYLLRMLCVSFAVVSVAATNGGSSAPVEYLFNGGMELGAIGEAAPNYYLRFRLDPAVAFDPACPPVFPVTVAEGKSGKGLRVPALKGMREYNLESEHFIIPGEGDVEISFWARAGADPSGVPGDSSSMMVDFRCYNQAIQYGSVSERYPVLEAFTVPLHSEWTRYTRILHAKAGYPYSLWFRRSVRSVTEDLCALEVDEISIRPASQPNRAFPDEIVAVPDRFMPIYREGEIPRLAIRALLNSQEPGALMTLRLTDDEDQSLVREIEVAMTRDTEPESGDPRAGYTGSVELAGLRYGSFSSEFHRSGQTVPSRGGDLAVVHPVVRHPRYSPGWSLGFNWEVNPAHALAPILEPSVFSEFNGVRVMRDFMEGCGAQLARIRAPWRITEPQKDNFQADNMSHLVDLARDGGMDVVFLLADTFTHAPAVGTPLEKLQGNMPAWLYRDATVRPGVVLPPLDRWEKYVEFCATTLKDRVDIWEVVNEPSNGWNADEYLPLLQSAYRILKDRQPNAVVLGNGATGDLGLRPIGWTKALAALGHEKFLDAVAFHPYEAALDSLAGNYFKHRDVIQAIRATLEQPRPLWNTEVYYMKSATRRQTADGEGLGNLAAGDITRHYLESLLHGIVASMAPSDTQFVKRRATVPSSVVPDSLYAGVNTLSWLLRGMTRLEPINVNGLVCAGLFTDSDGKQGLGFIYDQRASGSRMTLRSNEAAQLEWLDLFGNVFTPSGSVELRQRPLYCRGEAAAVRSVLSTATFQAEQGVQLTAKGFRDRLAVSARNLAGVPMRMTVAPDSAATGLPERFDVVFTENRSVSTIFPADANLSSFDWTCKIAGMDAYRGRVEVVRPPVFEMDGQPIPLSHGSPATVRADGDALVLTVTVKDAQIVPAKSALWEGDALEVFLDADPFYRLDLDAVATGDEPMNVAQYIFAVVPSADGERMWAVHHRRKDFQTGATTSMRRTEDGYELEARIPLAEITPMSGVPPAIGLNLEIDHVAADGKRFKETLAGPVGESYCRRMQYPLFLLSGPVRSALERRTAERLGVTFPDDPDGETGGWTIASDVQPYISWGSDFGMAGRGGYRFRIPPEGSATRPDRGIYLFQRLPVQRGLKRSVTVSVLAKLDNVQVREGTNPGGYVNGFFSMVHYYDGTAKKHLQNEGIGLNASIAGSQGWTCYQYRSEVPDTATEITLSVGLRGAGSGTLSVGQVSVSYDNR